MSKHAPYRLPLLLIALATIPARAQALQLQQQKKQTKWVSYAVALADAEEKKRGVFIYFRGKGQKGDHEDLGERPMIALSQEHPCVKVPYDPEETLREEMEIPDDTTVVITDWFGNELRRIILKGLGDPFPLKTIQRTLENMPTLMRGMQKKLARKVSRAGKELEKKNYRLAIDVLREVMKYEGYPAVEKAREGLEKVCSAGEDIILEAFIAGQTSMEDSIATLKRVMVEFKGTRVEAGAQDAIEKIKAMAKKRDR